MASEPYEYISCIAWPLDEIQACGKHGWRFAYTVEVAMESWAMDDDGKKRILTTTIEKRVVLTRPVRP